MPPRVNRKKPVSPFILAFAGLTAGWFIARAALGAYLPIQASCGEGCVPGSDCAPGRLDLRVEAPSGRAGKPTRVWYKASFTNTSCAKLQIKTDFLTLRRRADLFPEAQDGFFFEFKSPNGEWKAERWKGVRSTDNGDTAKVQPYAVDWESKSMYGTGNGLVSLWLDPGVTATNLPSVYKPHKYVFMPVDGGHDFLPVLVSSTPRIAPEPPDGYRLLDEYLFPRPGRYSLRLVFNDKVDYKPRYAYKQLSPWIFVPLDLLAIVTGTLPEYFGSVPVEIRSKPVDFEVR